MLAGARILIAKSSAELGKMPRRFPSDPMCEHCSEWVHTLDLDSDRQPKIRDGFFVYQLDTGYIGMTYNPSKRQKEHEVTAYMDGRADIESRPAYHRKMMEDWPVEYAKHWSEVRKSDPRYSDERRLRWLSPILDTREMAFRCEWALKSYQRPNAELFPGRFDQITSLSSTPVIALESSHLLYDTDSKTLLFGLEWKLSGELGPSQIVPVSRYELERFDDATGIFAPVSKSILPAEQEG